MKRNCTRYAFILLGLAFGTCAAAHAAIFRLRPEIDPSLAVSGLALLAGSLALLRARSKK